MTTRRVQYLTERIAANQKTHKAEMAAEQQKRDQQRLLYENKLRKKDEVIIQQARESRERIANERRQSHALRSSLVQVSRLIHLLWMPGNGGPMRTNGRWRSS